MIDLRRVIMPSIRYETSDYLIGVALSDINTRPRHKINRQYCVTRGNTENSRHKKYMLHLSLSDSTIKLGAVCCRQVLYIFYDINCWPSHKEVKFSWQLWWMENGFLQAILFVTRKNPQLPQNLLIDYKCIFFVKSIYLYFVPKEIQ